MKRAVGCYKTMDLAVREEISRGLAMGWDQAQIALQVGFAPSSVSREIRQHDVADVGYRAYWAQSQADDAGKRRGRCRATHDGVDSRYWRWRAYSQLRQGEVAIQRRSQRRLGLGVRRTNVIQTCEY